MGKDIYISGQILGLGQGVVLSFGNTSEPVPTYIASRISICICMIIIHMDITFGLDICNSALLLCRDEITLSPCVGDFELGSPDASGSRISG